MSNRRRKSTSRKQNPSRNILIAFGVFINVYMILSFLFGEMGLFNAKKVRGAHHKVRAEIRGLQRENKNLTTRIEALRSDADTIERLARDQLGFVKEGELVFEFLETTSH